MVFAPVLVPSKTIVVGREPLEFAVIAPLRVSVTAELVALLTKPKLPFVLDGAVNFSGVAITSEAVPADVMLMLCVPKAEPMLERNSAFPPLVPIVKAPAPLKTMPPMFRVTVSMRTGLAAPARVNVATSLVWALALLPGSKLFVQFVAVDQLKFVVPVQVWLAENAVE